MVGREVVGDCVVVGVLVSGMRVICYLRTWVCIYTFGSVFFHTYNVYIHTDGTYEYASDTIFATVLAV